MHLYTELQPPQCTSTLHLHKAYANLISTMHLHTSTLPLHTPAMHLHPGPSNITSLLCNSRHSLHIHFQITPPPPQRPITMPFNEPLSHCHSTRPIHSEPQHYSDTPRFKTLSDHRFQCLYFGFPVSSVQISVDSEVWIPVLSRPLISKSPAISGCWQPSAKSWHLPL